MQCVCLRTHITNDTASLQAVVPLPRAISGGRLLTQQDASLAKKKKSTWPLITRLKRLAGAKDAEMNQCFITEERIISKISL